MLGAEEPRDVARMGTKEILEEIEMLMDRLLTMADERITRFDAPARQ
jgi:hypothetical protein